MAFLKVFAGGHERTVFLGADRVVLGRDRQCDVPLDDLKVIHYRPIHGDKPFKGALRDGRGAYNQHYRASYLLARAAVNLFRPPYLLRGIGLLAGYLGARLRRDERIDDPELVRYIREEQRRRLRRRLRLRDGEE